MKRYEFTLVVRDLDDGVVEYQFRHYVSIKQMDDPKFWTDTVEKIVDQADEAREDILENES